MKNIKNLSVTSFQNRHRRANLLPLLIIEKKFQFL